MPCGWVDISLSINSVGSSSFGSRFSGGNPQRIYARDKENRIHRGGILCTAGPNISKTLLSGRRTRILELLQRASAIHHEDLPGHEFRMNQEYDGVRDV